MNPRLRLVAPLAGAVVLLAGGAAGCGAQGGTAGGGGAPSKAAAEDVMPPNDTGSVPADLLRESRADLDRRLAGANVQGAVRVVAAEAVTWRDGSLGCPRPGMSYTMALVPGYRVVYAVRTAQGEREYAYHAGRHGGISYCEDPSPPLPGNPAA